MGNLVESIKDCGLDKILGVRDKIGAALKKVKIITREWDGDEPGHGNSKTSELNIFPSPRIVSFDHDVRLQEGGYIQQGDILLKGISKSSFPDQKTLDNISESRNIEKFYDVGGILYQIISIKEKLLTWNVHLRRFSDQRR